MAEPRLSGKRALVTGAGTGIGKEIAQEFGRQGADVVLHYSKPWETAGESVEMLRAQGRRASAFQADFTDVNSVERLYEHACGFLGGVDLLVNNAGITFNKPFLQTSLAELDTLHNVNFRSPFRLTQLVTAGMIAAGGGAICNISSIHGLQGAPEHCAYASTKGAIIAYTRALAVELAHKGVRVNAIAPGWITVENYARAIPNFTLQSAADAAHNAVPVGRYGLPQDIAMVAAFLCSGEAQFIVGQTITVDGGTTALMSLISDFRGESDARFGTGYMPTR